MASEISDEMVEAAARALCRERISAYFTDPVKREAYITDYVEKHWTGYDEGARASLTAALAVQARTHVVVRRDDAMDVVASLAATISVIERTPQARKAAMSDKAFGIMLDDYTKALARGRAMLATENSHER